MPDETDPTKAPDKGGFGSMQPGQADAIAEKIARDISVAATKSGRAALEAAQDAREHLQALLNPALMRYHGDDVALGIKLANSVTGAMGSWRFIIIQTAAVAVWVALNIVGLINHWDPYPFILLNLMFSVQAAYASPLILMAGNVAASRDRDLWEHDYKVNQDAYAKIANIELRTQEMLRQINQLLETRMPGGPTGG